MDSYIIAIALGLFISILGIINMMGNISSLHRYHRYRVTEENRKPFGKLVGTGTLIMGVALIVFGVLFLIIEQTKSGVLAIIATVELIAGVVAGLGLSFYAMIKYNKGIF